ncbi:hypothetical protein PF010_g28042 [Phytophthora fragariae]|uniref:Uncharacterized protein n=1 Tax=Phytophthora fragariae TaxID=53985 RepID=A0A6G0JS86_9STRA|nr:hypothetical protein PF010_g28042 [Phytophthora fragariae]
MWTGTGSLGRARIWIRRRRRRTSRPLPGQVGVRSRRSHLPTTFSRCAVQCSRSNRRQTIKSTVLFPGDRGVTGKKILALLPEGILLILDPIKVLTHQSIRVLHISYLGQDIAVGFVVLLSLVDRLVTFRHCCIAILGQLTQLGGELSHLSSDLALLLAKLVPLLPESVPFLAELPDLGDLRLVMRHPRLDVFEALYGVVPILDQVATLGVDLPTSFLGTLKGILRLRMLAAGRI